MGRWGSYSGYGIVIGLFVVIIGLFIRSQTGGATDWGDAPYEQPTGYPPSAVAIGAFPSPAIADGARATLGGNFQIGTFVSGEADYNDPQDPDPSNATQLPRGTNVPNQLTDYDDGVTWEWRPANPSGVPADFIITVEAGSDRPRELYFNVLIDHNMDGDWEFDSHFATGGEWQIRNWPIAVSNRMTIDLPGIRFPIGAAPMPECFWMRVVLSERPIEVGESEFGWAGTGAVGNGEIEDVMVFPTTIPGECTRPPAGT